MVEAITIDFNLWGNFGFGALVGASVTVGSFSDDPCLNGISNIVQEVYMIYHYGTNYMLYNQD
jgi:hypothetical protein